MKSLQERIGEVAYHLQSLLSPEIFPRVQEAVEKGDKTMLIKACRTAKIPDSHISSIVPMILSAAPRKWPEAI